MDHRGRCCLDNTMSNLFTSARWDMISAVYVSDGLLILFSRPNVVHDEGGRKLGADPKHRPDV